MNRYIRTLIEGQHSLLEIKHKVQQLAIIQLLPNYRYNATELSNNHNITRVTARKLIQNTTNEVYQVKATLPTTDIRLLGELACREAVKQMLVKTRGNKTLAGMLLSCGRSSITGYIK